MIKIIASLFLSGLLFGSGPCLASCGPILISYVAGAKKGIFKSLTAYILFSSARISVYVILGLLIFYLGKFSVERLTSAASKYIFALGGGFIILIGVLIILGEDFAAKVKLCQFLKSSFLERDKKSIIVLGLVIGLLPCAPLIAVFSYTGLISKSWLHSLVYSLSFGIGTFVSPLVLLAAFAGFAPRLLKDRGAVYSRIFNAICGFVLILLGVQLASRAF